MQIAQLLAGYSLGEADLLRRAMGKKIKAEMEAQRDIFVKRSIERGLQKKQATAIFDLIAKFAEYGFNKSHAAAYGLISYQTAYLKANYTVEFIAASMTYDMGNTDKLSGFREEAAKFGVAVLPPDINKSGVLFEVENSSIRYALAAVRNVGPQAMQDVVTEREKNGPYKDIFDFVSRVPGEAMNRRAFEHLIKAGAFDTLHSNRNQLLTHIERIMAYGVANQRDRDSQQESLFGGGNSIIMQKPNLPETPEWPALEKLEHEFSSIGFYLSAHPLAGYKSSLETMNILSSTHFAEKLDSQFRGVKVAGIVTGRKFKVSDKGRFAFIQLSDMGGAFEISIFNEALLSQHRDILEVGKILLCLVDAKMEEAGPRFIAQTIMLFDEALIKQQQTRASGAAGFRIVVDQAEAVGAIRTLLGESNGRGVPVMLSARLGTERADIRLPGKYALSPTILDRIRVVKGVVSAEEEAA